LTKEYQDLTKEYQDKSTTDDRKKEIKKEQKQKIEKIVSYKTYGNTYQYYPLISKKEYSKKHLNKVFSKHFKNSIEDVVTFFADNNEVNVSDIDAAIKALEEIKEKKT